MLVSYITPGHSSFYENNTRSTLVDADSANNNTPLYTSFDSQMIRVVFGICREPNCGSGTPPSDIAAAEGTAQACVSALSGLGISDNDTTTRYRPLFQGVNKTFYVHAQVHRLLN